MSLFSRAKETEINDETLSAVLRVREAARGEWTRPVERESEPEPPSAKVLLDRTDSLPWSSDPPRQPGVYWWRPEPRMLLHLGLLPPTPRLAVVVEYGHLCVRRRRGEASAFVSVGALQRQWAGPLPLAEGMDIEDLEIVDDG